MTAPFRSRPALKPGGGEVPSEDGSAESLRSRWLHSPSFAPLISVDSLSAGAPHSRAGVGYPNLVDGWRC